MKLANKIRFQNKMSFRPRSVSYLMVILFLAVGAVYIFAVNFVANKGAKIRTIETSNKELQAENERLTVEAARLASLRVIEDGASREVEVGDLEKIGELPKDIVFVPEMVITQQQRYLPSYTALAQR